MNQPDMENDRLGLKVGFDELLLIGVIVLALAAAAIGIGLYLLPSARLEVSELQPAVRVVRTDDFPVGASRVINWGERIILVVRSEEDRYFALEGTSPADGCILRWDLESSRVVSPCTYLVYDLRGNVVVGLSTVPLQRYTVFIRGAAVYVTS